MPNIVLVLGPVAFSDFEIPERIRFGGAQRLVVHKLPGGARVIDALGRDDAVLTWSGIFSGPGATERARLLDLLRVQGAVLPLTWDVFFYSVVIASFDAEYRNGWWIPYRLTCTVLVDEAEAVIEAAAPLAVQGLSDLASASGLAGGVGVDLGAAQAALSAPGATALGSTAYAAAQASLGGAQAMIGGGIAAAEAQLAPIASAAVPFGASSATAGIAALRTATAAAAQLGALTEASGYLNRTTVNLSNAST